MNFFAVVSAGDCCDECAAEYSGQVFEAPDDLEMLPPLHPNCRCDSTFFFTEDHAQSVVDRVNPKEEEEYSEEVKEFMDEWDVNLDQKFVSWEMENGHEHTMKIDGTVDVVPIDMSEVGISEDRGGWEAQMDYIKYVEETERTSLSDVKTANTFDKALDKDIIWEQDGQYMVH
jgi:hypothetical protein